jgi:N-acylneuraminate cytidylyltransferase
MSKILAFIPARGGSKGIPNKNIKLFNGKPLVEWTINSALKSKLISKVIVSSDSKKILSISKKLGAETVLRPKNISGDFATTESAIKHYIKNTKESFDTIVLLSPTSPIRKINDIDNAIKEFKSKKLDSCFSASILLDFLIWKLNKKKKYESINYNFQNRGTRQKRDLNYVENGSIYVFKTKLMKYHNNRIAGKIGIYLMNFWQSFEIDVKDDWKFLETIQKTYIKK